MAVSAGAELGGADPLKSLKFLAELGRSYGGAAAELRS